MKRIGSTPVAFLGFLIALLLAGQVQGERAVTCPDGEHESDGHCCGEGAEWVPARQKCFCLEKSGCPEKSSANERGDDDSADNPQGKAPGEWVRIKGGVFMMGSPTNESGRLPNEVLHRVKITRDFMMQTTEVTQGQFVDVMGYNPSKSDTCGSSCPVEQLSWHEAARYCNYISELEGLDNCYVCNNSLNNARCDPNSTFESPFDCPGYRLPTEAEWEYAARAGTKSERYGELDEIAWHRGNSDRAPHKVGEKQPNDWGLYDILGNVFEWCHDFYQDEYPEGSATDPWGPESGAHRVLRGGSYFHPAKNSRAAPRTGGTPGSRIGLLGFRPVKSVL